MQDTRDSRLDQLNGYLITDTRGYHQNLTLEPLLPSLRDKINCSFGAQIDIQQNHGCAAAGKFLNGRSGRSALAHYCEARLFLKDPRQSLAEHGVIVQQKEANC